MAALQCALHGRALSGSLAQGGATALAIAAQHGDLLTMECLVRLGADVNTVDAVSARCLLHLRSRCHGTVPTPFHGAPQDGRTPLMLAAKKGCAEAVHLLLAHGADVNAAAGPEVSARAQSSNPHPQPASHIAHRMCSLPLLLLWTMRRNPVRDPSS